MVLGPRQVGKTTGVLQIQESWDGGSLYVSADEEIAPTGDWLKGQWLKARQLPSPALLIVDEIQAVPDWSSVVKGLWDEDTRRGRPMAVVLLGSSSLSLHHGLGESLAGRFERTEVPHWSFAETHLAFGWNLDQYLEFGGYPGPGPLLPDLSRWHNYLNHSIIEPVISRDILATQKIAKPALFRQLFEVVMEYPAQCISYQKILGQLQEGGNASTAKHYCQILADAFLIACIPKFSTRGLTTRTSSPKLVPLAPALVRAVTKRSLADQAWRGRLFEAAILGAVFRAGIPLTYWNEGSAEVDMIVQLNGTWVAFEIKSGRRRAGMGLTAFKKSFPDVATYLIDPQLGERLIAAEDLFDFFGNIL